VSLDLRPYQREAIDRVREAEQRGLRRIIVAKPTGSGKTVTFAHLIKERGGRAVVLAHRDELVRQAADKIRMVTGIRPGIVKADEDEYTAQVVVASVQTLARPARLRRLMGRDGQSALFGDPLDTFPTVIVDEVHHYLGGEDGNTFGHVLDGLGAFAPGGPLVVGFTATPERGDGSGLGGTWQEIVFSLSILDGIRGGWLSNIRAKQVQLVADFSKLHVRAGEFKDEESAAMLMEADAPKHAAQAYLEHAKDRRALVFTPTVFVAKAMAEAFRAAGVPSESVDGEMPMDERRAVLARLSRGETMVVPNAQVLTEGFDEPSVSCIVMARPTRSRPFAIQCIGRGTRIYPGKTDCLVLDLVGTAVRQDLVTVATLFELNPEAAEGGVLQAVEKQQALALEAEATEAARLVSTDVDLFASRVFTWVEAGLRWILTLGTQGSDLVRDDVVIEPGEEAGRWDVVRIQRKRISSAGTRPRFEDHRQKLHAGLDIGYAMGAAESYARKQGAAGLLKRDAKWRQDPATDKQQSVLKRMGLWEPGMTKGRAKDVMDRRFARSAYSGGHRARRSA
jgi:superfamily II DNA or RNA helicase